MHDCALGTWIAANLRHKTMHRLQERPATALDMIFMRRSVRTFGPERLDESTIRSLLDAAVQAPTATHAEPWAFVVVQDEGTLKRCSDRAKESWVQQAAKYRDLHPGVDAESKSAFAARLADPGFSIFYDASTLIVICARPLGPFVVADCWLAAENLMLAASALGLGTCCIGSAIPALNSPEMKGELGIPGNVEAVAPIIVGVPRGPTNETPRKDPVILRWK
jgi:nitroreductase